MSARTHRHIDVVGNESGCTDPAGCAAIVARFWSYVEVLGPDDCWKWHGSISVNGYGEFHAEGKPIRAHRWSLQDALGRELGEGMFALHHCDNKPCVNPRHLYEGTHSDNLLDRVERGGHYNATKTHCVNGHPFSLENTVYDRDGHRGCRICAARRKLAYKQRKRLERQS